MEQKQLKQIESWFKKLNEKFNERLDTTDRKIENRYTALLTVCTNLSKNQETFREKQKELCKGQDNLLKGQKFLEQELVNF